MDKVNENNEVICLVSMFPSNVMVLKLSKKLHFFSILCWPKQTPKSIHVTYIYTFESSHYTVLENVMVNRGPSHHSWDISN